MKKLFKALSVGLCMAAGIMTANAQYYTPAQDLVLGQSYTFTWDATNDCPGTCLKFTAPSTGVLTIMQGGTDDSHMYSEQWVGQHGWNPWDQSSTAWYTYNDYYLQSDNGSVPGGSAPYEKRYSMVKGQTYYYYARIDATDSVSIQNSSFESSGDDNYEQVEIGETFGAYNTVKEFTPEVTGIMTVKVSSYVFGMAGTDTSFLYTSPLHPLSSQVIPMNPVITDDYEWMFMVEANKTYYFWQSNSSTVNFTITSVNEQATPLVQFANAQPTPGEGGLDDLSFVGGINVNLMPTTNVGIGSAKFIYTSSIDGTEVIEDLPAPQFNGAGNWSILGVRDLYIQAQQGAAKPASMCKVVLEDITLGGIEAETADATNSVYVSCEGSSIIIEYYIPDEYGFQASKIVMPDVIYSHYDEPGQANGIATIVFNNNIKQINEISFILGTHYWGSSSGESVDPAYIVPYTIDGNTLTLDFTTMYLNPNVTADATKTYSNGTLFINGIMNEYGILWGEDGMNTMSFYPQWSDSTAPEPAPTMDKAITLSPLDGNTYALADDFSGFIMNYWDALPEDAENYQDGVLKLVNENNNKVDLYIGGNLQGQLPVTLEGSRMIVELGSYAGQNAEYMIWIEQGLVENAEGLVNPSQGVSCKVLEANNDYVLYPTNGSHLVDNVISIEYPGSTLLVNESCPEPISWANNRYMGDITVAGDKFEIPLYLDVMEEGTYDLIIPATYFVINASSLNNVITASYLVTPSGVTANFIDEDSSYSVYRTNGVKVMETADKSKLNTLGKGLYIINGKKVIVK